MERDSRKEYFKRDFLEKKISHDFWKNNFYIERQCKICWKIRIKTGR